MPPPPANKGLGRGSGKDGRPLVADLIQARETESALRKQHEEESKQHEAFRWEETCRTARIIEEKKLEYFQQVQKLRGLSSSDNDSNPPPGLLTEPEPVMTFDDARSSDSSDPPSTPEHV